MERSDLSEIIKAYDIKIGSVSAQLTGAIEGFSGARAARPPLPSFAHPSPGSVAGLILGIERREH